MTNWTDKWFSPQEIKYTPEQCLFLISNLEDLREGRFPPECRESGYTGNGGQIGHHAPFETPAMFAAELDSRLQSCSTDGELLFAQVKAQLPLSQPARQALRYVSGWKRKETEYKTYCRIMRFRWNVTERVTMSVRF